MTNAEARVIIMRYMQSICAYIPVDLKEAFNLAIASLALDEDDLK